MELASPPAPRVPARIVLASIAALVATLELKDSQTRLERVPIAANLRHDQLDGVITEASLNGETPADYAFAAELAFAHRLARHLKAAREVVRGKPENFNRPDYNFRLEGNNVVAGKATLDASGLALVSGSTMADAAQKIVKLVA